jgi:hypothetical protein
MKPVHGNTKSQVCRHCETALVEGTNWRPYDGRRCIPCRREYTRQWLDKSPHVRERMRKVTAEWITNNKERQLESQRRFLAKNPDYHRNQREKKRLEKERANEA